MDGDARGGAAISMRAVTGVPISSSARARGPEALEPFDPERMAGRILGMGDVLSLIEQAEAPSTRSKRRDRPNRSRRASSRWKTLPTSLPKFATDGAAGQAAGHAACGNVPAGASNVDTHAAERQLGRTQAILQLDDAASSDASRMSSTPAGSGAWPPAPGTTVQEVNQVLRQYQQMRRLFKQSGNAAWAGFRPGYASPDRAKARRGAYAPPFRHDPLSLPRDSSGLRRQTGEQASAMVRIRLRRVGAKHQPSYRLVVADKESPRDGRFLEVIGHYNPRTSRHHRCRRSAPVPLAEEGAQPSELVTKILRIRSAPGRAGSGSSRASPLETLLAEAEPASQSADTRTRRDDLAVQEGLQESQGQGRRERGCRGASEPPATQPRPALVRLACPSGKDGCHEGLDRIHRQVPGGRPDRSPGHRAADAGSVRLELTVAEEDMGV